MEKFEALLISRYGGPALIAKVNPFLFHNGGLVDAAIRIDEPAATAQ